MCGRCEPGKQRETAGEREPSQRSSPVQGTRQLAAQSSIASVATVGRVAVRESPGLDCGIVLIGLRRLLLALSALLLAAVGIALASVHPRFFFGTLVGDDAGYYLAIARNVCLGHGLSFDRLR